MRLFKALVVLVALLDAAMFLQSPASPLSATSPSQVVGYATASMSAGEPTAMVTAGTRP